MLILVKAALVLAGLLFVFFALGSYLVFENKSREIVPGTTILYGFVAYFFLFELLAFPMMIAQARLRILTIVWTAVIAVLVLGAAVRYLGNWKTCLRSLAGCCSVKSVAFWVLCALILAQILLVALRVDNNPDAAYYVANVSTNLATNTINCYEPFTGAARASVYVRYLFGLYPVSNSVICDLTGLAPLVLTKTVLAVLTVILSYLVFWMIGMKLFSGKKERVYLLLCFISVLNLNFNTGYSGSLFLLTRGYEGKAILANVLLPLVFFLGIEFYENAQKRQVWLLFFLLSIAGVDVTMSAMTIMPAAISAVVIPVILCRKQWKLLVRYVICMLPSVLIFIIYFLASRGVITFVLHGLM